MGKSVKVARTDDKGNVLEEFESLKDVCEKLGLNKRTLKKRISENKPLNGMYFKTLNNDRAVVQIDYYTGYIIDRYDSIQDAAFDNFLSYKEVSFCARNKIAIDGELNKECRFNFIFEEELNTWLKTRRPRLGLQNSKSK